jgi:hypothetical protein
MAARRVLIIFAAAFCVAAMIATATTIKQIDTSSVSRSITHRSKATL